MGGFYTTENIDRIHPLFRFNFSRNAPKIFVEYFLHVNP